MIATRYFDIHIPCPPDQTELLASELMDLGYEGTWEQEAGVHGYIPVTDFNRQALDELLDVYGLSRETAVVSPMDEVNWNEEWEKSYEAITVLDRCLIRADFHPKPEHIQYDIVIQPKMSFGTGHHDSTRLITELMLDMDFKGRSVIDVGCGTGVLAILAGMMGASPITAIDNNPWSYENTLENAERNHVGMEVIESDIEQFDGRGYDIILSNITRNINHQNIPKYARMTNKGGILIMSGFFDHDFEFLNDQAIKHGFRLLNKVISEKNWIALKYESIV